MTLQHSSPNVYQQAAGSVMALHPSEVRRNAFYEFVTKRTEVLQGMLIGDGRHSLQARLTHDFLDAQHKVMGFQSRLTEEQRVKTLMTLRVPENPYGPRLLPEDAQRIFGGIAVAEQQKWENDWYVRVLRTDNRIVYNGSPDIAPLHDLRLLHGPDNVGYWMGRFSVSPRMLRDHFVGFEDGTEAIVLPEIFSERFDFANLRDCPWTTKQSWCDGPTGRGA